MEKRVIVFLIVSLAVIIGYDYLLKGMGLLPPSEPVQVATNPSPAAETGKPGGGREIRRSLRVLLRSLP